MSKYLDGTFSLLWYLNYHEQSQITWQKSGLVDPLFSCQQNGGYQQGGKLYQNNNNLYANNDEDAMNSNTHNQESEVVKLRRQLDILKQKVSNHLRFLRKIIDSNYMWQTQVRS